MNDLGEAFRGPWADELLDELLPEDLDWRRLTLRYPAVALALAATGGFALAWARGPGLVAAVTGVVTRQVARNVESALSGAVSGVTEA